MPEVVEISVWWDQGNTHKSSQSAFVKFTVRTKWNWKKKPLFIQTFEEIIFSSFDSHLHWLNDYREKEKKNWNVIRTAGNFHLTHCRASLNKHNKGRQTCAWHLAKMPNSTHWIVLLVQWTSTICHHGRCKRRKIIEKVSEFVIKSDPRATKISTENKQIKIHWKILTEIGLFDVFNWK